MLLAVSQIASRVLGIIRDASLATMFGASGWGIWNLDTYFTAFRIPDLIYNLVVFGALSAALVPLLAGFKKQDKLNEFTSNVLNAVFVTVLGLSILAFIFAQPIAWWLAPGLNTPDTNQAAELMRIQLLAPIFFSFSAVFSGLAQHFERFAWYALAPVAYNLGIIISVLLFGQEYGVYAASWGVAAGAALHAAIQIPGVWRMGFRWQPILDFSKLGEMAHLAFPRIVALGSQQLQLLVLTAYATLLGAGALTMFNYAFNLASLPLGVIGLAVTTVSFNRLAKIADQPHRFAGLLTSAFNSILFWVLPAAAGLYLLRHEITGIILETGNFTANDTAGVASELAMLAWAIPFFSLFPLLQNAFFARKQTLLPLAAGTIMLAITVACALLGRRIEEFAPTPGLTFALASAAGSLFLFWQLRDAVRLQLGRQFWAALAASLGLLAVLLPVELSWQVTSWIGETAKIAVFAVFGAALYFGITKLLGGWPQHVQNGFELITKRLSK